MVKPNIEAQEEEGTALMPQVTAILLITEPGKFEAFYETIVAETDAFKADLSTALSRAEIAKMARKVAKTKTFLDATGKALNDEARTKMNAVDASRRAMRERLDTLRDKVRLPLTEWEDREAKRVETVEAKFKWFGGAMLWPLDADLGEVKKYRDQLMSFTVRVELFQDKFDRAKNNHAEAIEAINLIIERAEKMIADAADLERLQKAEADRQRKADAEAATKAADLKQAALREKFQREADDKAERQKQEVAEAVETAKKKAKREADAEIQIAREASEAEIRGLRVAEAQRKATADLEAKEQARRERNKKHRAEVELAATIAIATAGQIERVDAELIVEAIIAGGIPRVRLEF